jgi:hypothetical protein
MRHLIVLYKRTTKYTRSFLEVFRKIENVRTQSWAKQCTHFAKEFFCCTAWTQLTLKISHRSLKVVEKLCAFVDERMVEVAILKFSFLLLPKVKCVIERTKVVESIKSAVLVCITQFQHNNPETYPTETKHRHVKKTTRQLLGFQLPD